METENSPPVLQLSKEFDAINDKEQVLPQQTADKFIGMITDPSRRLYFALQHSFFEAELGVQVCRTLIKKGRTSSLPYVTDSTNITGA